MTARLEGMEKRRLIHYSEGPLSRVWSRPHDRCGSYKTTGLWVSVEGEDDWLQWCHSEQFGLSRLCHATEIILHPDANVMRLTCADEIDAFTLRFGSVKRFEPIDWLRVRDAAHGLIIAPYCWERRLSDHTTWYYGWDCASGVIWDADAIAELNPLPCVLTDSERALLAKDSDNGR